MSAHPITGVTTVTVGGKQRTLAFDMNCAAALHEALGEGWNDWLVERFVGKEVAGGRQVMPLTPGDIVTALHALLATDREDHALGETEKSLRRTVSPVEMMDIQMAMLKVVLTGFGVPGEFIEAVVNAVDPPRESAAADGTGTKRLRSRSGHLASRHTASGG